ncbi:DUF4419 domain-containing protein [Mucilaginibacter corticis]|uniref:DUF4419 domain-containing protein n=1 Tax=Mucilaginibacter corticis TaxID=2597670 RepID=A0A556MVW5_9SPHI|nr:DUF4419 domain-containing protein [Mucilaginibacter corticis]TSJ44074.1 DUF4419 domain-containing protein [Mucilaginibacter corticis]
MKKSVLLFLSVIFTCNIFAQKGITFKVEKLSAPKTKIFATESYDDILEKLIKEDRKLPGDPGKQNTDGQSNIVTKSNIPEKLVARGFHPFFEGMYAAYADHHPFTLSPDMIWLLISQGFANHVNNNAELLRDLLVNFEGKKTLAYTSDHDMLSPGSHWEKAFASFDSQIATFTGRELTTAMTSNFSTTTLDTKIASQITLMNAVQSFFNYNLFISGCGIPQITLEGTTKDWESVLNKTEAIRKYQLDWWIDELEPILKQFIQASKGKADKKFWQAMFKYHTKKMSCGPNIDLVDGWIVKFFPYDKKGRKLDLKELSLSGQMLPNEFLKVNLDYTDATDPAHLKKTSLELWAGFVGLDQNVKTYGLKPRIGWMIRKKDPFRQALIDKLTTLNNNGVVNLKVDNVPPETWMIGPIKKLVINFFGNIRIPDELGQIKIDDLTLNGTTQQPEIDRIVKMFPNTSLYINGQAYNVK